MEFFTLTSASSAATGTATPNFSNTTNTEGTAAWLHPRVLGRTVGGTELQVVELDANVADTDEGTFARDNELSQQLDSRDNIYVLLCFGQSEFFPQKMRAFAYCFNTARIHELECATVNLSRNGTRLKKPNEEKTQEIEHSA